MRFYLDASVLLPMLVAEPGSAAVDAFLEDASGDLIVGDFAAAEVGAALSRLVRTARLEAADAESAVVCFWQHLTVVWLTRRANPALVCDCQEPDRQSVASLLLPPNEVRRQDSRAG